MRANKLETALSRDRLYSLSGPTRYVFFHVHVEFTRYVFFMYLCVSNVHVNVCALHVYVGDAR